MTYDLHALIRENDVEGIKTAIANGADINARGEAGKTPLAFALQSQEVPDGMVKHLLQYDPDITITSETGKTPLHFAMLRDNTEFIKVLIEKGADINARDQEGSTPLMWALHFSTKGGRRLTKDTAIVGLFSYDKLDVRIKDRFGNSPIHEAVINKKNQFIKMLIERGTDINARDQDGRTPLMIAMGTWDSNKNNEPTLRLLLQYNPDVTVQDNCGNTVISLMRERDDLSDALKGVIFLRSLPGFHQWKSGYFVGLFREKSRLPREIYDMITSEFADLVHPEIPLEDKLCWLKAYDKEVYEKQASAESEQVSLAIRKGP